MTFAIRFIAITAAVYLTVNLVPGITVTGGWVTMLLVALIWAVIVNVIRPILRLLMLPITIITLGLFNFIVNALLFWAVALIVPGFQVAGFLPALLGSIVLSVLSWVILRALP
ncbi:phage holin family protein [Candidatus Kaiserbacteria bacterium]|nr:phage holin family protein [Candidatus Kaiserbacteria bacterium]